jgi:hypothetical protein
LRFIELRNKIYSHYIEATSYPISDDLSPSWPFPENQGYHKVHTPQRPDRTSSLRSWIDARALAHTCHTLRTEFWPMYEAEVCLRLCIISVTALDSFLNAYYGGVTKERAPMCRLLVHLDSAADWGTTTVDIQALLHRVVTHNGLDIFFADDSQMSHLAAWRLNELVAAARESPDLISKHLDRFWSIRMRMPIPSWEHGNRQHYFSDEWYVDFAFGHQEDIPAMPEHVEPGSGLWWDISTTREKALRNVLENMKVIRPGEQPRVAVPYAGWGYLVTVFRMYLHPVQHSEGLWYGSWSPLVQAH